MRIAHELATLGTCCRAKVGCLILRKDGTLAGGGYNGAIKGMPHCTDETCNSKQRCLHTSHAEENAVSFSSGDIHTAFVTHEPCLNCTRMLARRGLKHIYYTKAYNSMPEQERAERDAILKHCEITLEVLDV